MQDKIKQDLMSLHLSGMADCWENVLETRRHQDVTLNEGLQLLIQAEIDRRAANKTSRLIKHARFRYDATIEDIIFDTARGKDKDRILQLATCEYIRHGDSVTITGPTGVGKSFLASALGYQACLAGYKVAYFNMSKLLERIQLARIESKEMRFFDKMMDIDLLIIEDFGMKILEKQQLLDFYEIIEDRHGRKAMIITSQLPIGNWYDVLSKNATIADSILDKTVRMSYQFNLSGDSLRKK